MKKVKPSEAHGKVLSWMVSMGEGWQPVFTDGRSSPMFKRGEATAELSELDYAGDPRLANIIIERFKIATKYEKDGKNSGWRARMWFRGVLVKADGRTFIEAAMRCAAIFALGDVEYAVPMGIE